MWAVAIRNGQESFRFVRNGLESFLSRYQGKQHERHETLQTKEVMGREGRRTAGQGAGWRKEGSQRRLWEFAWRLWEVLCKLS